MHKLFFAITFTTVTFLNCKYMPGIKKDIYEPQYHNFWHTLIKKITMDLPEDAV